MVKFETSFRYMFANLCYTCRLSSAGRWLWWTLVLLSTWRR